GLGAVLRVCSPSVPSWRTRTRSDGCVNVAPRGARLTPCGYRSVKLKASCVSSYRSSRYVGSHTDYPDASEKVLRGLRMNPNIGSAYARHAFLRSPRSKSEVAAVGIECYHPIVNS